MHMTILHYHVVMKKVGCAYAAGWIRYGIKKRARSHIELVSYEKHYLLNNTITCAFSLPYFILIIHDYQLVPFAMHAHYLDRTILAEIIAEMVDIDTQ